MVSESDALRDARARLKRMGLAELPVNGRAPSVNGNGVGGTANQYTEAEPAAATPREWELPIPLTEYDVPPFPVDLLPKDFGDFVNAVATSTQTPTALPAMIGLSVIAAAAQKRVHVRAWTGWDEPVNLYTSTSLSPANRKSTVVREMATPLRDWERAEAQRLRPILAAEASDRRIKEAALKRAEQRAAHEEDETAALKAHGEARTLAEQLDTMQVERAPRLLVDDITPEKLGALMAEHHARMAVISAEGSIFDVMAGRFSKDGKMPALDLFLRGHSGDDLPIDRLGREGGYLTAPALTLGLAIQPHVLTGLARRPGFRGTGLLARFAFALPESLIGRRQINPDPVPDAVRARYAERITQIINLSPVVGEDGTSHPHTLELSTDARQAFIAFLERHEARLGPGGDLHHLDDWAGKLGGLTLRLAGLCHTFEHAPTGTPWAVPLSTTTLTNAIALAERFLVPHALAAFGEMGADPAQEQARIVLDSLARWEEPDAPGTLKTVFSRRDLHQRLRRRFPRPQELDGPLALLAEHGYIRLEAAPQEKRGPGRKPSDRFEINPRWERTHNPPNTQIADADGNCEDNVKCVYTADRDTEIGRTGRENGEWQEVL